MKKLIPTSAKLHFKPSEITIKDDKPNSVEHLQFIHKQVQTLE